MEEKEEREEMRMRWSKERQELERKWRAKEVPVDELPEEDRPILEGRGNEEEEEEVEEEDEVVVVGERVVVDLVEDSEGEGAATEVDAETEEEGEEKEEIVVEGSATQYEGIWR